MAIGHCAARNLRVVCAKNAWSSVSSSSTAAQRYRPSNNSVIFGIGCAIDLYYDPYDVDIDRDPYPVWRRLRDEAPLYYNERHDFYAISRYDDVKKCSADWATYISGSGSVLEIIKSGSEMPSGLILFEDPPEHNFHRGLLSRVFHPKSMEAVEPDVRRFCETCLDPLVGSGRFDFIADLGAEMPMRTIGMLLGIPEEDQRAIRDEMDLSFRLDEERPTRSRVQR